MSGHGAGTGRLVVISGPSGAGKTSVCRAIRRWPQVEFSVSATTRAMRAGEVDGRDYHFLDRRDFERRVAEDRFLEWAEYNGNLYGTLREPMEAALAEGRIYLLEIEVQGTRQLRRREVPGTYVFIVPPDLDTLRDRLTARGTDSAEVIAQRLAIASEELAAKDLYDHVVVNDTLDRAIDEVQALLGLEGATP